MNQGKKRNCWFLLSLLLGLQLCYAAENNFMPVKINKIHLHKVRKDFIEIIDYADDIDYKNKYRIGFGVMSGCAEPFFNIRDRNLVALDQSFQQRVRYVFLTDVGPEQRKKLFHYQIYSGAIDRNKVGGASYVIEFQKDVVRECENIIGSLHEIAVELLDGKKVLAIKNISFQEFRITGMHLKSRPLYENKEVPLEIKNNSTDIIIAAGNTYNLILQPKDICTLANEKAEDRIYYLEIEYLVNNILPEADQLFEVLIYCSCDWSAERLQRMAEESHVLEEKFAKCRSGLLNVGNQLAAEGMKCE